MIIKKDTIIMISQGEYSDYFPMALGRAVQDIETDDYVKEYLELFPDQAKRYEGDLYKFAKWLIIDKNLIEEIPYAEWHLGCYGILTGRNHSKTVEENKTDWFKK